jgi:hypothetical protein
MIAVKVVTVFADSNGQSLVLGSWIVRMFVWFGLFRAAVTQRVQAQH